MTIPKTNGTAPARPPLSGVAEVRVPSTGAAWAADVDELEDGVMRLRLQPTELGAMPTWSEGTAVDCTMDTGRHSCVAEARVVQQSGEELSLRIPREWLRTDRRASARRLGGFAVSYRAGDREGTAKCVDISEGGMCLEVAEPMPLRERLELSLPLLADAAHTWVQGTVVYVAPAEARKRMRLGVAFASLSPESHESIARYCAREQGD